ncbi:MAG: FtsX-like permease family protein [Opitutaceae bacterium]|nr:FtsX-like permease family protein [Opitutaceae bacterium]
MLNRLLSAPGFAATALLSLLLGIGVNVSMLSIIDALIYREAPFPHAEQLVLLTRVTPQYSTPEFAAIEFNEIRDHLGPGTSITAFSRHQAAMSDTDRPPEHIDFVSSSPELFSTLGLSPQIGRTFTAEDIANGRHNLAVISHSCWQSRFGGDPNIIGHAVRLDGEALTIIGVMPVEFEWAKLWGFTQLWRPLAISHSAGIIRHYTLIARRPTHMSAAGMETALNTLAAHQQANRPTHYETPFRYRAESIQLALTHRLTGQFAWLLTALAGFVLLIACANLANLQLARSSERTKEFAIRLALGCSRGQLLREQLREPLFLAAIGGAFGLLIASGFNQLIATHLRVRGSAKPLDLELDPPLILTALLLALISGVTFGLLPAWASTRVDPNSALKSQDRGSTGKRNSNRLRNGLIISEIALALTLLSGAATLQKGFTGFSSQPPGWDSDQVISANLPISSNHYPTSQARNQLFELLERELPQLPGVSAAAVSTSLPTLGYTNTQAVISDEQDPLEPATHLDAFHVIVSPRYFATVGIPLHQGRTFPSDISSTDPPVVVINRSLARHLWPNENPIGQRLATMRKGQPHWAEVIGVVDNVTTVAALTQPTTPFTVYQSSAHDTWTWVLLTMRSTQPAAQIEALRKSLRGLAPNLTLSDIATPAQTADRNLHNLRVATKVLSLFGLLGLGLATVGIYGVVTHLISQRTREFVIRMTLGAQARHIVILVLREGRVFIGAGIALGLVGAFALNALLNHLIPRFTEMEPLVVIGVAVFLAIVAFLACLLPVRRVVKIDPAVVLREE